MLRAVRSHPPPGAAGAISCKVRVGYLTAPPPASSPPFLAHPANTASASAGTHTAAILLLLVTTGSPSRAAVANVADVSGVLPRCWTAPVTQVTVVVREFVVVVLVSGGAPGRMLAGRSYRRHRDRCRTGKRPHAARAGEAVRYSGRGRRCRPGRTGGVVLRPARPERRRQDHDAVDGGRAVAPRRGARLGPRPRCLDRSRGGQAPHRGAARGRTDVRPAHRHGAARVHRAPARYGPGSDRPASPGAARRFRPGRRGPHPRGRLLGRDEEEGRAGVRVAARPAAAGARRAVRGGRPRVGIADPRHPAAVRPQRRHGRLLQPCHGDRREAVQPRGDPHRRRHQGGRHPGPGARRPGDGRRVRGDRGRARGDGSGAVMALTPGAAAPTRIHRPRVRHFVRLKLRILRNGLRGSARRILLLVFGALSGLELAFAGFVAFTLAGTAPVRTAETVTAFIGAALVLAWTLVPLLFFGVDETLDPARFALLPVPRRTLALGMLTAALIGIPAVATSLALLGLVLGALIRGGPAAAAVALVGAVLALLLCVAASRALTGAFAGALRSRRVRDLAAILIAALAASFGFVPAALQKVAPQIPLSDAARMADVLSWTPLAAPFAAPYDVAAGRPLVAVARLSITVVAIALLVLAFSASLESAMTGTASSGSKAPRSRPAEGYSAVTALYPRRRASLISLVMVSLVFGFAFQLFTAGEGTINSSHIGLRAAVIMMGVFSGLGVANQSGYEGTAFAAHLLTGVPGRTELRARQASLAIVMVPVLLAVVIAMAILRGDLAALPAGIGILVAGFGASLALSTLLSVVAAYPMPESANPFVTNAGTGAARGLLVFVGMFGAVALIAPVILAGYLLSGPWSWLVMVGGIGYGVGAALLGTYIVGDRVDQRGPELLAAVTPRR